MLAVLSPGTISGASTDVDDIVNLLENFWVELHFFQKRRSTLDKAMLVKKMGKKEEREREREKERGNLIKTRKEDVEVVDVAHRKSARVSSIDDEDYTKSNGGNMVTTVVNTEIPAQLPRAASHRSGRGRSSSMSSHLLHRCVCTTTTNNNIATSIFDD